MKPFEGALQPLQQSKENLLLFKSHTQKRQRPHLCRTSAADEKRHTDAEGAGISALRNSLQSVKMKRGALQEFSSVFHFLV